MKQYITGAAGMLGVQLFLAGTLFRYVPTDLSIGPIARVIDSLSPWSLVLALIMSTLVAAVGSFRFAGVLLFATLAALALFVSEHRALSLPTLPEKTAEVRILFFNANNENVTSSQEIISSILEVEPDIVVIVEPNVVRLGVQKLAEKYTFISPCEEHTCKLLLASKIKPTRFWRMNLSSSWGKRYAVAEYTLDGEKSFFLAASQISKPWLSGISEPELAQLAAQYNWFQGPVVAVGDFNAAPWSFTIRRLLNVTGMRALRVPPSTWPVKAGAFGVPIDQVLVRDGPRITKIQSFGDTLGSNHRGLIADIYFQ